MKKNTIVVLTVALLVSLIAACASTPGPEQSGAADWFPGCFRRQRIHPPHILPQPHDGRPRPHIIQQSRDPNLDRR